ncbi:hypothetical protein HAX54_042449 [Datura stramonium]|uniref:Uncharacterized protein n=1 Tax=Datura stramonium TaxID=4076 RepID=A0ABS8W3F5_DATST|nr:hypothetical protein [Datura stramonium]
MLQLRDEITSFEKEYGEPLHEVWNVNAIETVERMEKIDDEGPLVEKVTAINLECVGCCGENTTRSGKTLHNRMENVDEESMEQDYEAMLL